MSGHPLVVIGDSLSQGFMSGAVCRTGLAYPVMLAHALGVAEQFRVPDFSGAGGFPVNVEKLLRDLGERAVGRVNAWEWPSAFLFIRGWMDRCEDYWERGPGSQPTPADLLSDNLAIWGAEIGDILTVTAGYCAARIERPHDNLFAQVPEQAAHRTGRRVLNPSFDPAHDLRTQLTAARELASDGGIGRLLLWVGPSNALDAVSKLEIVDSTDETFRELPHQRVGSLLKTEHFRALLEDLAQQVDAIGAEHVFVITVPHATICPSSRGVSPGGAMLTRPGSPRKYFEFYTRPWIWDDDFDPQKHSHLSGSDAIRADARVDEYNVVIRAIAARHGWHVVEATGYLDDQAYRSNGGQPTATWPAGLVQALRDRADLSYLVTTGADGQPRVQLDTRYLWTEAQPPHLRVKGGLYSLDGIHPTTIGYGLLADLVLRKMREVGAADSAAELDWPAIVCADTLVGQPLAMLSDLRLLLGNLRRAKLTHSLFDALSRR